MFITVPTYEYRCESCEVEFEETLIKSDDIKQYKDIYPCPNCKKPAPRAGISLTNFNFSGGVRGESGVNGQSGSHDLDYPSLDKAIGRSSEKKWSRINTEKIEREKIRKSTGNSALTMQQGKVAPAPVENLKVREMALSKLKHVKTGSDSDNKK